MMVVDRRWAWVMAVALAAASCGDKSSGGGGRGDGPSQGDAGGDGTGGLGGDGDGALDGGPGGGDGDAGTSGGLEIAPADAQTLVVTLGEAPPTLIFTATFSGAAASPGWNLDRGDIGTLQEQADGSVVFTPSGAVGGVVTVRAGLNGELVEVKVLVQLVAVDDGADLASPRHQLQVADDIADLTAGGGVGGVGGEGLGGPVQDANVIDHLAAPTGDGQAQGLELIYPYDGTVWPRGMLAPLLMWRSSLGGVDAIRIDLRTSSGSFQWTGTFSAPAILAQTGGPFTRHPIPQDVWAMATDTAGGATLDGSPDTLEVQLTVAKGADAYGPVQQRWTVAAGRLTGTIYYASYGTNLAKNLGGAVGGDGMFGGAVLSIRVGDTEPALVAGTSGGTSDCRVCHSVSADGSRLTAVVGGDTGTSAYALTPMGTVEEMLAVVADYPALTPDGQLALTPAAQLLDLGNVGAVIGTTGLTGVATDLGTPAFSLDGSKVVFNPMASPSIADPTRKLVVMDYDRGGQLFSSPVTIVDNAGQPAEVRPGWPAFTPDGAVVFHQQTVAGVDGNGLGDLRTRKGAKAHLAWTPADSAQPVPLDRLNGLDDQGNTYLPSLAQPVALACTGDGAQVGNIDTSHADDANLNYEPTVNPVATGGYSWVVFTSRRMYGTVADIPPFCSDPRGVDLFQNITPKKLWVAAVNLGAAAGTDPSHPAFYLPAQELLAGNARGFWVLDPCRDDGASCETGDQCCNGFCTASGDDGALVCANEPPAGECAHGQERCNTAADCCDPLHECINDFCTLPGPQ